MASESDFTDLQNTDDAPTPPSSPRGPGRPRKDSAESLAGSPPPSPVAAAPKRKGRPPKAKPAEGPLADIAGMGMAGGDTRATAAALRVQEFNKNPGEKERLMDQINRFYTAFPGVFGALTPPKLSPRMSVAELKAELEFCQHVMNSRGSDRAVGGLFQAGVRSFERLLAPRLDNLSEVVRMRWPVVGPILQELTILYADWFAVGPEKRLLFIMGDCILETLEVNSDPAARAAFERRLHRDVDANMAAQYAHL